MTTPSRKSEIRRRRARKEKIALLRKRYAAAAEGDRSRVVEKLKRLSPTFKLEEFTKPIEAAKAAK
jgi:hypothetical protein